MKHADEVFKSAVEGLGELSTEQLVDAVHKAHIRGRPSTNYQCPMARLLDMQCNVKGAMIGVGKKYIIRNYGTKGGEVRVKTPPSVVRFLVNFDIGKYPEMFAPPPRALKKPGKSDTRKGDRHTGPARTRRKALAKRNLVALLGGRGHRAEA